MNVKRVTFLNLRNFEFSFIENHSLFHPKLKNYRAFFQSVYIQYNRIKLAVVSNNTLIFVFRRTFFWGGKNTIKIYNYRNKVLSQKTNKGFKITK